MAGTTRRATQLPSLAFPVLVFVGWRVVQLALSLAFGAGGVNGAFLYDGQAYRRIFVSGYHLGPGDNHSLTAFFPGVAWLTRGFDLVAPSPQFAEILTVNLVALIAFVTVYGVAKAWKGETIARRAVILLAVFPSSLFLWSFYSEGLFIALGAGAYWADRRNRHWLVAILLAGAAAARPTGILVAAVLVFAHILRDKRLSLVSAIYAVAGAVGLGAVMLQQGLEMGDPLSFVSAQKYWHRQLDFPWTSLHEGIDALKDGNPRPIKVLDLVAIGLVVLCVVYAARGRGPSPWPREAWLLPAVVVGVPLFGPYLSSMNRFALSAWPAFIIGAEMLGRTSRRLRVVWYIASILFAVAVARYWAHGDFIG